MIKDATVPKQVHGLDGGFKVLSGGLHHEILLLLIHGNNWRERKTTSWPNMEKNPLKNDGDLKLAKPSEAAINI